MHINETKIWAIKKNRKQCHAKKLGETIVGGRKKKAIVMHKNGIKGMSN